MRLCAPCDHRGCHRWPSLAHSLHHSLPLPPSPPLPLPLPLPLPPILTSLLPSHSVSPPTPLFGAAPTLPKSADGAYDVANLDRFLPDSAKTDQPAVLRSRSSYEPPSRGRQCLAKVQSGFMIGAALGGAFGFAYGR